VSHCYLDTSYLYTHLRSRPSTAPDPIEDWRRAVQVEATNDGAVISALVLDELAHRLILAWLRDDGADDPLTMYRSEPQKTMRAVRRRLSATWQALDSLSLELCPTDHTIVARARELMAKPGLRPRDAFHAAHALAAACSLIATANADFELVPGLSCLAP
jgi:predicted nucleic acid-binding protein